MIWPAQPEKTFPDNVHEDRRSGSESSGYHGCQAGLRLVKQICCKQSPDILKDMLGFQTECRRGIRTVIAYPHKLREYLLCPCITAMEYKVRRITINYRTIVCFLVITAMAAVQNLGWENQRKILCSLISRRRTDGVQKSR